MEETFVLELLRGYKKNCKIVSIALFVCLGIIAMFVAGLIYILVNYDFEYVNETASTDTGNACVGDSCNNGEINGIR